jgi:hypothetical protein
MTHTRVYIAIHANSCRYGVHGIIILAGEKGHVHSLWVICVNMLRLKIGRLGEWCQVIFRKNTGRARENIGKCVKK